MASENRQLINNFWGSFTLGFFLGGGIILLLGTKKGREFLKKLIQLAEEIETSFQRLDENLETKNEVKKEISKPPLNSVLEKIKSAI